MPTPPRTPKIPNRVFTAYEIPVRSNDPWVGLVFVDREGALNCTDFHAIMTDPVLKGVLDELYMGGPFRWTPQVRMPWSRHASEDYYNAEGSQHGILVAQRPMFMPDCRRRQETPFWVMVQGTLHKFQVDDMYRRCHRLHRLIGCDRCPDVGENCFAEHLRMPLPQTVLPGFGDSHVDWTSEAIQQGLQRQQLTWDWMKETFTYYKDKVAGFTYIPPMLASHTPTRPGLMVEAPWLLSFTSLESAQEELSARSRAGIHTRRTKRKECTKCYFGGTGYGTTPLPCDKYRPRSCEHGAWTTDQVMEATIPPFKAALEKAGYTMRQFEQVLAIAGLPFRLPTKDGGHAKWIVSKLSFDAEEKSSHSYVKVLLKRVSRGNRGVWRYLENTYEMWKLLPKDLQYKFDEAPTLSQEVLAVAIHMVVCHNIRPYMCMQGCCREVDPDISHVAVRKYLYQVEVGYWVATYWREMSFDSIEAIASYFKGGLPGFNLSRSPDDDGFNFNVWPRLSGIWG